MISSSKVSKSTCNTLYCTHNLVLMLPMQITLSQEVGQEHNKRMLQVKLQTPISSQQLNLSVFKSRSAETKPHQSDSFITLCQVQPPQHHSICLPTHQLQVNNGPALNFGVNLTQNFIRWVARLQKYAVASKTPEKVTPGLRQKCA